MQTKSTAEIKSADLQGANLTSQSQVLQGNSQTLQNQNNQQNLFKTQQIGTQPLGQQIQPSVQVKGALDQNAAQIQGQPKVEEKKLEEIKDAKDAKISQQQVNPIVQQKGSLVQDPKAQIDQKSTEKIDPKINQQVIDNKGKIEDSKSNVSLKEDPSKLNTQAKINLDQSKNPVVQQQQQQQQQPAQQQMNNQNLYPQVPSFGQVQQQQVQQQQQPQFQQKVDLVTPQQQTQSSKTGVQVQPQVQQQQVQNPAQNQQQVNQNKTTYQELVEKQARLSQPQIQTQQQVTGQQQIIGGQQQTQQQQLAQNQKQGEVQKQASGVQGNVTGQLGQQQTVPKQGVVDQKAIQGQTNIQQQNNMNQQQVQTPLSQAQQIKTQVQGGTQVPAQQQQMQQLKPGGAAQQQLDLTTPIKQKDPIESRSPDEKHKSIMKMEEESYENEYVEAKKKLEEVQQFFSQQDARFRELSEKNEKDAQVKKAQLIQLRRQKEELQYKIQIFKDQEAKVTDPEIARKLKLKQSEVNLEIASLHKSIADTRAVAESIKRQNQREQEQYAQLEQLLDSQEQQLKEKEDQVNLKRQQLEEIKQKIQKQTSFQAKLNQTLKGKVTKVEIEECQKQIEEITKESQSIQKQLEKRPRISQVLDTYLQKQVTRSANKVSLEKQMVDAEKQVDLEKTKQQQLISQFEQKEKELEQLNQKVAHVQQQNANYIESLNKVMDQNSQLKESFDKNDRMSVGNQKLEISSFESQLRDDKKKMIEDCTAKLAEKQREAESVSSLSLFNFLLLLCVIALAVQTLLGMEQFSHIKTKINLH